MLVEPRIIRHAVELVRHDNYARAAQAPNFSQPAHSRSIATLTVGIGGSTYAQLPYLPLHGVTPR
jgi:hypothetical protein